MGFLVLAQNARPPKGYSLTQQRMSLSDGIPLPVEVKKPGAEFFTGSVMQLSPVRRLPVQSVEKQLLVRGCQEGANGCIGKKRLSLRDLFQRLNARWKAGAGHTVGGKQKRKNKRNTRRGREKQHSACWNHDDGNGPRCSLMNR